MNNQAKHDGVCEQRRGLAKRAGALVLGSLGLNFPSIGFSQTGAYPAKPIRIVVGYPAGGSADVMARIVAEALRQSLGQNVVVDNQPGASGNIAAQTVARANPDGYTLLLGNTAEISINKLLMKDTGFDPHSQLAPIALAYSITHAIAVPAKSPYKTLEDLLADARGTPGKVKFASAGIGTPGHLAGETLALETGAPLLHIPYKGGSQVLIDLLGGELDCHIAAVSTAMGHVRSGSLRILAVTAPKRVPLLPDVPAVGESIVPGFNFPLWGGLFAPASTPRGIVALLNREVNKAYDRPDVQVKIAAQYSEIIKYTPEQFSAFLNADSARYRDVIKQTGIALK